MKTNQIEKLAPNLLLKRGVLVSVPTPLFLRLFGKKKFRLTLYTPNGRALLQITELYLQIRQLNDEEAIADAIQLYKKHSRKVHKAVAIGFLKEPRKLWRAGLLAWYLERHLTEEQFSYLYQLLIVHGGVEDFLNTIRLIEATRITKPMNLSQATKMS